MTGKYDEKGPETDIDEEEEELDERWTYMGRLLGETRVVTEEEEKMANDFLEEFIPRFEKA